MPSLEQLKQQSEEQIAAKKIREEEEIKQKQAKKDKLYQRKKLQNESFKKSNQANESRLAEELELRQKNTSAFRRALAELRKQFAEVKNNPDSIFAPFFERDEKGNPVARLNYEKVLHESEGIDEVRDTHQENLANAPKIKNLKTRQSKFSKIIEKSDSDLSDQYQVTTEYQTEVTKQAKEKLIKEYINEYNLKNLVQETYYNFSNNSHSANRLEPIFKKEITSLVLLGEEDKVKELRDILRQSLTEQTNSLKEKNHLDRLSANIKTIKKFNQEKSTALQKIITFENEVQNFARAMDSVEEFGSYFGSENSIINHLKNLGSIGSSLETVKNTLHSERRPYNEVLNLQLLEKEILAREAWMQRILKLKDENQAEFTKKRVSELGKEFLKLDNEVKESLGLNSYDRAYFEELNMNKLQSLTEAKDFLESKEKVLTEAKDLISNYYNLELTKGLKFSEIVKLRNSHNSDNPYEIGDQRRYLESLTKEISDNENTLTDTYHELSNIQEARNVFRDKLAESINFKEREQLKTMLQSSSQALMDLSQEIREQEKNLSKLEKELGNLKNKKLGHFESRRKWQAGVDQEESKVAMETDKLLSLKRELDRKVRTENESQEAKLLAQLFGAEKNFSTSIIPELARDLYHEAWSKNATTKHGREGVSVGEFLDKLQARIESLKEKTETEKVFYQDLAEKLNEYKELFDRETLDLKALQDFFKKPPSENIFNKRSEY